MVYRLSDESLARAAKSSASRSRRPRNRLYPRQGTSSSDAPASTPDPTASSSSDPSPSSSSDAPMTTHTTSMHDTESSSSSHVMTETETPTSTSHSMVEPSTTQNDPTSSSRAGSSSMHTTVPSTTQNMPSTSTRAPSSTLSTSAPNTTIRPTSSLELRTTPTTTPESSTAPPTTRSTSDATSTPPPSSSSDPPSTSSSPLTTTTPPPPASSTSSSGDSTTSITPPASSEPISTDRVSLPPPSSTPEPTPSSATSTTPPPETQTNTSASTTPPAASSTSQETTNTPTESATSSAANAVVTSGSVIISSASDVQVSVTTTNSLGQTTVAIPSLYTTTYTSTSNGVPLTITAVVSQATTLNTDGGGGTSPFFKNKGAVAGVFIVVGIAGAAIILFGVFTFLRRRKMSRLTREAAIAATLGSGRTPFVDDDDADAYGSGPSGGNSTEMGYHSASDTRPVYGGYGAAYGAAASAYGYGPDPFYSNPPAGKSFNASPPGSIDQHVATASNPQGLFPLNSYGATGGPNLPPTTPLLANGNQVTVPPPAATPASPPSIYSNPKGYEYDYSNYVPPSAVDGLAGRTLSPSPTSPTFSKRSSLPAPPPGAAVPGYAALAIAAGLVSDPSGPPATNLPPSAYQGPASSKVRRTSNTPSFASSASRYSVESPAVETGAGRLQPSGLPTYSVANVSKSQSGHSFNASSSNQSHRRPSTPGAEAFLSGDRGGLIRSASGGSDWKAPRPETPLIDHRLDPDTILAAKGRSPANANRLSDYSTPSEESLGSLQDHEDYSRRVLQVTNPS